MRACVCLHSFFCAECNVNVGKLGHSRKYKPLQLQFEHIAYRTFNEHWNWTRTQHWLRWERIIYTEHQTIYKHLTWERSTNFGISQLILLVSICLCVLCISICTLHFEMEWTRKKSSINNHNNDWIASLDRKSYKWNKILHFRRFISLLSQFGKKPRSILADPMATGEFEENLVWKILSFVFFCFLFYAVSFVQPQRKNGNNKIRNKKKSEKNRYFTL